MQIDTGTITVNSDTGKYSSSSWVVMEICRYCGQSHNEEHCPRVKEIRYRKNGRVKWVEFHEPQPMPVYIYPPYYYHPPNPSPYYPPYKWTCGDSNHG